MVVEDVGGLSEEENKYQKIYRVLEESKADFDRIPMSETHSLRNPNPQVHLSNNLTSENHITPNSNRSQNHRSFLNSRFRLDSINAMEDIIGDMGKLYLNNPSYQSQRLSPFDGLEGSCYEPFMGIGHPQFSYHQSLQLEQLQRMRIQSAVSGQIGVYSRPCIGTSDNTTLQEGFSTPPHSSIPYNQFINDNRITAQTENYLYNFDDDQLRNNYYSFRNYSNCNGISQDCNCQNMGSSVHGHGTELSASVGTMSENSPQASRPMQRRNERNAFNLLQDEEETENIEMVFSEVTENLHESMMDPRGNYAVQRMFERSSVDQMNQIVVLLIKDHNRFKEVCLSTRGTRVMQRLLECLKTREQIALVISARRGITVSLTLDSNGSHVIERCMRILPAEDTKHLLHEIADKCVQIAKHRRGCCVIQQCLARTEGDPLVRLVNAISSRALELSSDSYGNYVMQYIISQRMPGVCENIAAQLCGSYVQLSKHQCSSNVVESLLRHCPQNYASMIIEEIMSGHDFLSVALDPYGNYVIQTAFTVSKGAIQKALSIRIQGNYFSLNSHPHGKRVLALVRLRGNTGGGRPYNPR